MTKPPPPRPNSGTSRKRFNPFNLRGRTLPYRHPFRWHGCVMISGRGTIKGRLYLSPGQVYHLKYGKRRPVKPAAPIERPPQQPPPGDVTVYV